MANAAIMKREPAIEQIDFTQKRMYVCGKGSLFLHVANSRDPMIRDITYRDLTKGLLINAAVSNDLIPDVASRFGFDSSDQWWSQDNSGWQYQQETEHAAPRTERVIRRSRVYFIFNAARNKVKIGYTRSVDQRLTYLQTASSDKLELLGHIEGDRAVESQFHARFAEYKSIGEWFDYTDEVRGAIDELLNR